MNRSTPVLRYGGYAGRSRLILTVRDSPIPPLEEGAIMRRGRPPSGGQGGTRPLRRGSSARRRSPLKVPR